jgi:hypothetical protein
MRQISLCLMVGNMAASGGYLNLNVDAELDLPDLG